MKLRPDRVAMQDATAQVNFNSVVLYSLVSVILAKDRYQCKGKVT